MAERRRGLGKGLGALIPSDAKEPNASHSTRGAAGARPVDVFFGGPDGTGDGLTGGKGRRTGGAVAGRPTGKPREATAGGLAGASGEPGDLMVVPGTSFQEVALRAIRPNRQQPRQIFDSDDLDELAASIKEVGLLQPVVVRPLSRGQFELVMGERRWRAAQQLGLATIPAIVRHTDDADMLRDALLENLHRAQLNPLEEAAAYQQLLDDFGCTQEELATRLVRSRPQITNTLRLLKLPPLVQRRLAAGVLSAGHARALLGLDDQAAMERLAQRIVAEGLSVRSTEQMVALGDVPLELAAKPGAKVRPGSHTPALDSLQERLADKLDTRVKVVLGKAKGRITIEFASVKDLERIVHLISPDDPGLGLS